MIESINTFIKGISSDYSPQNQPENTYREAYNIIRRFDGSIIDEKGTTLPIQGLPSKEVMGHYVIDNKIVLLYVDEIGVVDKDIYVPKLIDVSLNIQPTVQIEGKINYKDEIVIYFVDGVNPDRFLNLSDVPLTNIDDNTRLVAAYTSPKVEVTGVDTNGEVPTGIYQFASRLVTKSFNSTPFGLITNVLPIVDEDPSVGRNKYDGAIPGTPTNKSVNLKVSNIDTDFEYIEIGVITYKGITNQLSIHTLPLIPINKRSEITYTYSSPTQHRVEITREQLQQEFANYDKSKTLSQKDGVLIRGNLTSTNSYVDLSDIAKQVRVEYFIHEIPYSEDINPQHYKDGVGGRDIGQSSTNLMDYKGEMTTYSYKSYMRGEVYAFGLSVKFKNQSPIVFHIPGSLIPTGNQLNGYTTSSGVVHHQMPTLSREPLVDNGQTKLRLIGLRFSNIDLSSLTPQQLDSVEEIRIVRQERKDIDKTILTQGIAQRLFKSGELDLLTPLPFTGTDIGWNGFDPSVINNKAVAFYSPETVMYEIPMTRARYIQPVMRMYGNTYGIADQREGGRETKYAHTLINYNRYAPLVAPVYEIDTQYTEYIPKDNEANVPYSGLASNSYNTRENNGYVSLWTKEVFPKFGTYGEVYSNSDLYYKEMENATDEIIFRINNSLVLNQDRAGYKGVTERYVYNILTGNSNPYGELQDGKYILIGEGKVGETIECFGGDTFISKFSVISSMSEVRKDMEDIGLRFRTLNYFFVESSINTNYRHYELPKDGVAGTIPYYPRTNNLWVEDGTGILQIEPKLGHSVGYNKQYSFDNNLVYYFPVQLGEDFVEKYSNRLIYSLQAIEGEKLDAYRVYLPNNYHDISKHKGEITDIWVQGNTLRVHTPYSLFRTFFNEQTTVATSSGEVTLGNGGLFPRPAIEEFTPDGGYAGCLYPTGVNTPFGRVWVDNIQKKIFMFTDNIKEISLEGLQEYCKSNIIDTPYHMGWDASNRRLVMSGNFTISYTPELDSFSSFHNYQGKFITSGDRFFMYNSDGVGEMNKGERGNYFGVTNPITLRLSINKHPLTDKSFDNIVMDTTQPLSNVLAVSEDKVSEFKELVYSNDYDFEPSDEQIVLKKKGNEYRCVVPRATDDSRFKGKWLELGFTYNREQSINLKYITVLVRAVAR